MKKGTILTFLACLAFLWIRARDLDAKDTIVREKGGPIRNVEVVSEDLKEVRYKREGIAMAQRIPSSQVKDIEWDDAPSSYLQGIEFYKKGDYENAVQSFKLARDAKGRDWIKLYSDFYVAKSLQEWGEIDPENYSEALSIYDRLLSSNSGSRLAPAMNTNIVTCLMKKKDFSNAEQRLRDFQNRVFKEDYYEEKWKVEVLHLDATLSEEKGDFGIAFNKWKALEDFARKNNHLEEVSNAIISQGKAILKSGSIDKAEAYFRDLIHKSGEEPGSNVILAGAHNGLGECYLQRGEARAALLSFCQVRVRYFQSREERARATYLAAKCAEELANKYSKEASSFRMLAQSYGTELKNYYKDTEWAKKVK